MTIRHKAYMLPLDKGLSSDWNDDHEVDFEEELIMYDTFLFDDLMPWWSIAQCSGGGGVGCGMSNNHNFVEIASGGGGAGLASMRIGDSDMTNKLDLPIATFTLLTDTIDGIELGFFRSNDAPFTALQIGAYFRIDTSKIYAVTGDGVNEEAVDVTPPLFAIAKYYQLRIEFGSSWVKFYIDNLLVEVSTNTQYNPTDDLTFKASVKDVSGTPNLIHMDGFGLERLRKK